MRQAAAGSRDARKVGAFKYTSAGNNPAMIVVMSVEEQVGGAGIVAA